jgi:FAD/FMN-containing dehydrogenase
MAALALPIMWRDSAEKDMYEKERINRIFNAIKPNRYPRAIVKATCSWHVQEAVRLANKLQCRVSVRSGGHSWASWSLRDDVILIDLEELNEIELDEDKKIVKVSPSTTGMQLNESLGTKGLMFGAGHCPEVGLGGFLLQGGMGWNCKVFHILRSDTDEIVAYLQWLELGMGL